MSERRGAKSSAICEGGGVLIELILALPFFLVIPLVVIEISQWLRIVQIVNVVAQEVGNDAYRSCADFTDIILNKSDRNSYKRDLKAVQDSTAACLTQQIDRFTNLDDALKGEVKINVSVYRYFDPDAPIGGTSTTTTPALYRVGQRSLPSGQPAGAGCPASTSSGSTKCSSATIKDGNKLLVDSAGVLARKRMVVAEVEYTHTGLSLFGLMRLLSGSGAPVGSYRYREVAIL